MDRVYTSLKEHKLYGPVAVLFGHLLILALQSLANCIQELDGELYSHAVMAASLTGAYIYSWTVGNPHSAIPLENQPVYEIPLMLASGYYASCIFCSQTCADTIQSIISIMAVSGIFTDNIGANVFATQSFLVEIASLVYLMRDCAVKCRHSCKVLLDAAYPIVLIGARAFALWHLTYMIVISDKVPIIHKVESVILTICSFYYVKDTLDKMMCHPTGPTRRSREVLTRIQVRSVTRGRDQGRSKSRSRSRPRSRSRSNLRIRSRSRIGRRC